MQDYRRHVYDIITGVHYLHVSAYFYIYVCTAILNRTIISWVPVPLLFFSLAITKLHVVVAIQLYYQFVYIHMP